MQTYNAHHWYYSLPGYQRTRAEPQLKPKKDAFLQNTELRSGKPCQEMLQMLGHYKDPIRNDSVLGKRISLCNLSIDSTWTWDLPEQLQFWGVPRIFPVLGIF